MSETKNETLMAARYLLSDRPMVGEAKKKGAQPLIKNHMTGPKLVISGGMAATSASLIAVRDAMPSGWWEAGPWVAFLGSMIYAVGHLWRALRRSEDARESMHVETARQHREMMERHAESIERLSRAIEHAARGRKPKAESEDK